MKSSQSKHDWRSIAAVLVVGAVIIGCGKTNDNSTGMKTANGPEKALSVQGPQIFPLYCQTQFGWGDAEYAYVDSKGRIVTPPVLEYAGAITEGLAVAKPGRTTGRYGYVDGTGKFVIVPQYDNANSFSEGLAAVLIKEFWGYIDSAGRIAIKPRFAKVGGFTGGRASVWINGKWGYIDRSGKLIIPATFDSADSFSEGRAAVETNGQWGYIDIQGKLVSTPKADSGVEVRKYSQGLAAVCVNGKWGFINISGNFAISPQYADARDFREGLAPVKVEKVWGYIDTTGRTVISAQFDSAKPFSEGLAEVGITTNTTSLDAPGGIPMQMTINTHNVYGYINQAGKTVIAPQFDDAGDFEHGLAWVNTRQSSKSIIREEGYIDKSGNYIWNPTNRVYIEAAGAELLLRQLRSQDLRQHFEAAVALSKQGNAVVPALKELLESGPWHVQLSAAWALGEIRDPSAVDGLLRILESDDRIGPSGFTSYVGDMTFQPQRELSFYDSPNSFPSWNVLLYRRAAAIALGKIGDKRAIEPLARILAKGSFADGAEANVAIARAIQKLGGTLSSDAADGLAKWGSAYK